MQLNLYRSRAWLGITVFTLCCLLSFQYAAAQTKGLIYKPATSGGNKILDPNNDGYVSVSTAGFSSTTDEGAGVSEIPYRPFPALTLEPTADLNTGSNGGHTDLATPASSSVFTGSPIAAYFDGKNLLFRVRLGNSSTASKGYSVLIDSDNSFSGTGINPGFEFEVLLASNFAVQVIRHSASGTSTIFTGSVDQYSQRAVAGSVSDGNADYFYDFYVPLTAFNGGITASTPLRMSGITITSAQSGITGTVSDVGGVNFAAYNYDAPAAWRALIGAFPATSLSSLQTSNFPPVAATPPRVNSPLLTGTTEVSGTSVEAQGSTVTVYRSASGGTATILGTATVSATGTWTLSGLANNQLASGDVITATVAVQGKSASAASSPVTVISGVCTTPPPIITGVTGGSGNSTRQFQGTSTVATRQRITVYSTGSSTPLGTYDFAPSGTAPYSWTTANAYTIGQNNFYVTVTPLTSSGAVAGCESLRSNQICIRNGNGNINEDNISITGATFSGVSANLETEIPATTTSLSGTIGPASSAGATTVVLFINGVEQTASNLRAQVTTSTSSSTPWTINLPNGTLKVGDVVNVRTSKTLQGGGNTSCTNSFSSRSNLLNVSSVSATPTINPPSCGLVTSLTGTSTEPAGTVLQFYTGGTAGARNGTLVTQAGTSTPITAVVGSAGNWSANFTGAQGGGISAGTVITARAKAPGKVRSVNSNAVSATAGPSGTLSVTGPIAEGSTSISGTGPTSAAGGSVIVYIDGTPFNTPVLVASNGTWTVSGFAAQELFAGASVTATYTSGQCESKKGAATVVQCKAPQANYSITPVSTNICGGSTASFTLSGSEYGVSYRLLVNGAESGSSVVGTGSAITLTSAPIANTGATSTNVNISYRARKISGTACDATSSSISYGVRPQPTTSGLSFSTNTATVCAGSAATFTLAGTNNSYFYQLLNQGTGQLVGDMVQGTGGSISLSTGTISSNTSFSLRVFLSNTDASACTTTLPSQISVTITSPSISRAVFADNPKVCLNGATRINVSTEPNSNYTYTVYRRVGTSNNPSSDPVLGTFTGNGDIRSVTTGALGTAGTQTFYVRVTNSTGSCGTLTLTNTAQVEVTNTAVAANAGPDVIICAEEYVLRGNDVSPGIGTWSQVSGPSTAVFSSVSNPTSTVSGLVSGTYTFRWQATSSCSGSSSTTQDEVVIRVNCPATYTLAIPQYRDDYANGEALASATDPDGTITAAALTQGTLPPGTALNTTTGAITVANRNNLEEGTYPLTITLTDQFGVSSPVSIVLRIYGNSPAITPLPVELVYFRAQVQGQKVQLQWLTASEEDNKAFVVERSADGKAFTEIGTVPGAGTTLQEQRYTFVDAKPLPAANYYRLKQVDYDGDIAYSGTELVNMQLFTTGIPTLQAWPNPFKGTLHLLVQANTAQEATIKLSDVRGRQVYTSQLYLQTGANELELQLKDLPSGLYILRVQGGQLQESLKLIHK